MPPRSSVRKESEGGTNIIASPESALPNMGARQVDVETLIPQVEPVVDVVGGNVQSKEDPPVNAEVLATIKNAARFQVTLSEAERDDQYARRMKLLVQLNLKPCHPLTEEAFEEWVDEAACQITRFQIVVGIFQEAWSAVVPKAYVRAVASIPVPASYEALVDKVARLFFPSGGYIRKLERDLHNPPRAQSVMEARMWVEDSVARFARLCARWDYPMMLSDEHLREMAMLALPRKREQDIRVFLEHPTLSQIWDRASKQENLNVWHPAIQAGNEPGFAANEGQEEESDPKIPKKIKATGAANDERKCGRCGQVGHANKQCPKRTWRCFNCNTIGHIAAMCRTYVDKDETGRIQTKVEPKPSGTVVKSVKDRFMKDRMATAEATLKAVRMAGDKKRQRVANKKAAKGDGEKNPPKKRKIDHPAGVAQVDESEEESAAMSDVEDSDVALVGIEEYVSELRSKGSVVRVSARVNGIKHTMIADTGASRSLCCRATAKELRLKEATNEELKTFVGLGELKGTPTIPVKVKFKNAQCMVQFYVLNKPNLPTLLGVSDLTKLGVLVDPNKGALIRNDTLEQVHLARDEKEDETIDTVTQKPKWATDNELREAAKILVYEKSNHLHSNVQNRWWDLLSKYESLWLRPKVGGAKRYAASFVVEGSPTRAKLRHLTPELQKELETQLTAMLEAGVLQPSKSAWGAAPVFVKKKDGGWRLCLDYRRLNKQMKSDRYPIPLLWQQIQKAAGHLYYVTIDLNWGFWNLPLAPESRQYTALVTHKGLFEFVVLPFGIKNSPPEFQRMMDGILSDLLHEQLICYIDDIVVYGDDVNEVFKLTEKVLERLDKNGLSIKLSKIELLKPEVLMLGHIVNSLGIRPNPKKVQGIHDAKMPKNSKQMRSFLGSVGFIRKFIPNCSTLIAPLTHLIKKNVAYIITDVEREAFERLKGLVSEHVLLNAPKGEGDFIITCDASDFGVGASLLQMQGTSKVVLEFASRILNKTEQNWSTYEKEAFAIRWAVERFEDYIRTGGATILTDHKSLEWIASATSGKVRRWALYLQQFDLQIQHISGEVNHVADWLSRSQDEDDPFNDDEALTVPLFLGEEKEAQTRKVGEGPSVTGYARIPTYLEIKRATEAEGETADVKETYRTNDHLRYSMRGNKLYIPKVWRENFLFWVHASRYGGHQGRNKTVRRLRQWVWWPNLNGDVAKYIDGCLVCQRMHAPPRKIVLTYVLERPMPFELISLDCVGPRQWWGKTKYYLSMIDHATRFMITRASDAPITTAFVIETLKEKWLSGFCVPYAILTDRGSEFTSKEFRSFALTELGCALVNSSPYYPQGNAICEASHKAIDAVLLAAQETLEGKFEDVLRHATQIHNACPHSATAQSPFYLLFGMEPTLPGWQGLQIQSKDAETRLLRVAEHRGKALVKQRLMADEQLTLVKSEVKPGDWVVYLMGDKEVSDTYGSVHKYTIPWSAPAKVIEVVGNICKVAEWHTKRERQVPLTLTRKLQGEVPSTLSAINEANLQRVMPRLRGSSVRSAPEPWDRWFNRRQPFPSATKVVVKPVTKTTEGTQPPGSVGSAEV